MSKPSKADIAAVMRLAGQKGGPARAKALSKKRRIEIARMGGLKKAANRLKFAS